MSLFELLIIALAGFILFGPKELQAMVRHVGKLIHLWKTAQAKLAEIWQQQQHHLQLEENLKQAKKVDSDYQNMHDNNEK